jgi:hypothetical protein
VARGQFFKAIFAPTEKVGAYANFRAYANVRAYARAYAKVRAYTRAYAKVRAYIIWYLPTLKVGAYGHGRSKLEPTAAQSWSLRTIEILHLEHVFKKRIFFS